MVFESATLAAAQERVYQLGCGSLRQLRAATAELCGEAALIAMVSKMESRPVFSQQDVYAYRPTGALDYIRLEVIRQNMGRVLLINAILLGISDEIDINWIIYPIIRINRGWFAPLAQVTCRHGLGYQQSWLLWPPQGDSVRMFGSCNILSPLIRQGHQLIFFYDEQTKEQINRISGKVFKKYKNKSIVHMLPAPKAVADASNLIEALGVILQRGPLRSAAARPHRPPRCFPEELDRSDGLSEKERRVLEFSASLYPLFCDLVKNEYKNELESLVNLGFIKTKNIDGHEYALPSAHWIAGWGLANGWHTRVLWGRLRMALVEAKLRPGHTRAIQRILLRLSEDMLKYQRIYGEEKYRVVLCYAEHLAQGIYARRLKRMHHNPDGLFSLVFHGIPRTFFLEVDGWFDEAGGARARSTAQIWGQKVARYMSYYRSQAWAERFARFPDLLIVASPAERSYGLLAQALAGFSPLPFNIYLADGEEVMRNGILASGWIDVNDAPCRILGKAVLEALP